MFFSAVGKREKKKERNWYFLLGLPTGAESIGDAPPAPSREENGVLRTLLVPSRNLFFLLSFSKWFDESQGNQELLSPEVYKKKIQERSALSFYLLLKVGSS